MATLPHALSPADGSIRGRFERLDILVVDDSRLARRILVDCLVDFGARNVREAQSGQDALDASKVKAPDLILVDWEMDGLNGGQFLREIRKDRYERAAQAKILVVTGTGTLDVVREAMKSGAHNFLVKPVKPDALYGKLKTMLLDPRTMSLKNGVWSLDTRVEAARSEMLPKPGEGEHKIR